VSVNATPESATAPGAVFGMVIVKSDVPPAEIAVGKNALLSVMPARLIVKFAVAGAKFVAPWVVVNASVAMVFV
jgi:hypothetical protein